MATRYLVTAVSDCEECGGSGAVLHAAWKQLRATVDVSSLTDAQLDAWFRAAGFEHGAPDEEACCYVCNGKGVFERRVDLSQALAGSYRELETRVDVLEAEPSTNAAHANLRRMAEELPDVDAVDAAIYDAYHVEWERDEWCRRANFYAKALQEISRLEAVDPDGVSWTWSELFHAARELAKEALR